VDKIKDLIAFLQVLIPIGAAGRIMYCLGVMQVDSDEEQSFKTRSRNVLIFVILAETIGGLVQVVISYF